MGRRQGCWGEQKHMGMGVCLGYPSDHCELLRGRGGLVTNYISQSAGKQVEEWAEVGPSPAHVLRPPCPCLGLFAVEQAWGHPGQWEPE